VIDRVGFGSLVATQRHDPLVLGAAAQSSESVGTRETSIWIGRAMWSYRLAQRAALSVTARRTMQSGSTEYTENSLLATLNMSF
jgi:hypothetical protein